MVVEWVRRKKIRWKEKRGGSKDGPAGKLATAIGEMTVGIGSETLIYCFLQTKVKSSQPSI